MKNKQINKFMFMLVIGISFLFTCSSAEIVANEIYTTGYSSFSGGKTSSIGGVDYTTLNGYFKDFMDNGNEDSLNMLVSVMGNQGYISYFIESYLAYGSNYQYIYFFNEPVDFSILNDSSGNISNFYIRFNNESGTKVSYCEISLTDGKTTNQPCIYNTTQANAHYKFRLNSHTNHTFSFSPNKNVIQMDYVSGNDYQWDGESYYYKASPSIEVPSFETSLSSDEIAYTVNNFLTSMHWKNRDSAYNHFFIQHGETDGKYLIVLVSDYMYKLLSGLYIPAGVSSVDYESFAYSTYSILFNNGVSGTFLPWQTDRFNYKLYSSVDGSNFDYLTDMDCKDFNKYRWTMDTPVIYSSFYLPFKTLLGNTVNDFDVTVNDYSEDIDLKFSDLVNSETGENYVFEDLTVKSNEETNPIIAKLSQFFNEMLEGFSGLFQILIDQIFNFSDFLLETYGENVVTLVFAILIKSVTVLVSSIALIFRAVGFILSLVAIPASSVLFSADVSVNSTGLSFTGLNWGARFIEGLNMLKAFSWNGLGLWTLFESFVSALEVILFVKIVRKHYSHTF